MRVLASLLAVFVLAAPAAAAPADIAGQWSVEFGGDVDTVPDLSMYIVQKDTKLTGYVVFATGQFQLTGTIEGDQFSIVWRNIVNGAMTDVMFSGTVNADAITGRVQLGEGGTEGELWCTRTSR